MANMRVHELAKELNISSKAITDMLSNADKKYTAMSGLGESEINSVKSKFTKAAGNTANKSGPKKAEEKQVKSEENKNIKAQDKTGNKSEQNTQDTKAANTSKDVDKKHISQVYFPQNSQKTDSRDRNNNRDNNQNRNNRDGYRNDRNNGGYRNDRNNDRNGGYQNRDNNGQNRDGYRNDRNNGGYRNDRNNDRSGSYQNRDNNSQNRDGYRNDRNNGGYRNDRNNDRNGGYQNRDNNGQNRDGYRNDRNNGGYRNDRNNDRSGSYQNRDNNSQNRDGYRNDRNNGGYRNDRNNDRNGGYQNRDNNGQNRDGYRNDRNNGGYRNDRNNDRNGGYQNRDNNGQNGGRSGRDGQGFSGQRRNDRGSSAPKDDFIFETKPDSRRPDSRKNDSRKNDRKKDNEAKENLKFANSKLEKKPTPKQEKKEEETIKQLILPDSLTIKELADKMKVQPSAIVKKLFLQGKVVTINQEVDYDTAEEIALEFNCICDHEVKVDVIAELLKEDEESEDDMVARPPVVCVMGHVDHGKTSLLDAIRETHVTAKESGGITQKIGAYMVDVDGQKITFLDTPGHEAFTAMRARGAKVTDVVIIIVAADDNVMPQTKEAINHAMAAGVPIVFAINKVDKPSANPDKIKEELAAMNFLVEEWGGKYQSQDISAKKGTGVKELLEKVLLEAEMLDLKANPNRKATGSIIESSLDRGRGYVATVLVSNGTLHVGDIVLAGTYYGKVKAMFNERNQRLKEAGPSEPVLILGLNGAPSAGDTFHVFDTDQEAREIANKREQLAREQGLRTQKMLTLDEVGRRLALGDFHELNVIVKGDVDGSVEALSDSLIKLSTEQIQVNVIHKGVGQISESDVSLAAASDAIIVGFQVRPSGQAAKLAEQEGVDIRKYSIIYDAIEEVKSAMEGMLAPTLKEQVTSTIEVREVFNISKVGLVAGAMVKTGKVKRSDKARLIRDGIVIFTGSINALKRFKDDVKEVGTNFECGISLTNCNDIKVGDVIETFEEVEVKQTL